MATGKRETQAREKLVQTGVAKKVTIWDLQPGDVVRLLKDWRSLGSSAYHGTSSIPAGTVGIVIASCLKPNKFIYMNTVKYGTVNLSPINKFELLLPPFEREIIAPWEEFKGNRGNCSTGSDPEVFALDSKGVVIPAWSYLKAKDKVNPQVLLEDRYYARAFYDGFQAEFTTIPGGCHDVLINDIRYGLREVLVAARKIDPKATLTHQCVVEVPFEMMQAASEDHVALGCAPSFNIYEGEEPLVIPQPKQLAIRFAGCHMHFSELLGQHALARTIKALDKIAGVAMVSLFEGLEDERRRQFYGRAGEYRTPVHGIEWRVPSSAVLVHPVTTYLCFDLARWARAMGLEFSANRWEAEEDEVREVVNACDVKGARKILARNSEMLREITRRLYDRFQNGSDDLAYALLTEGAAKHLPTEDMIANWSLGQAECKKRLRLSSWKEREGIERSAKYVVKSAVETIGNSLTFPPLSF